MRTISCGCCTGFGKWPNNTDRCTCHIHQDIGRGLPAKQCTYHDAHGHPMVTSPPAPGCQCDPCQDGDRCDAHEG